MITIRVRDRELYAVTLFPITSGSVGLPCSFEFDGAWDGLTKIATFRAGSVSADVALLTDECTVPSQVLATAGLDLWIGVRGANGAGTTVIPTVWGPAGHIVVGAQPSGVSPADPEPDWTAQVQAAAASALEKATAVEEAAERGDFDGYSPTVAVTEITGGHEVTITDAEGDHAFNVMDGEDLGYAWFDVNDQDGKMYVTVTDNWDEEISFALDETTGVLEVTVE